MMNRPYEHYFPDSPPKNVTPSHGRRGRYIYGGDYYYGRSRPPLVYHIHGGQQRGEDRSFPGAYSPIRSVALPMYPRVSPPLEADNLYATFSPPRRAEQNKSRSTPHAILPTHSDHSYSPVVDQSIFRPKQSAVIVARDHSNDASSITYGTKESTPPPAAVASGESALDISRNNALVSFPQKLHSILSSAEYKDYITWLPHGRAWRVLKPKAFEKDVLHKYFRSTKYASFMRQVNGWGFKRITQPGPDFNAYYQELFLRGLPDMCAKMKRPQKHEVEAAKAAPTEDPNFYRMPPLPSSESSSTDHDVQAVDRSASMSSISCAVFSKGNGPSPPRSAGSVAGMNQDTSSKGPWDVGHRSTEVAVNLTGIYDRETGKEKALQLSESDLRYLVQQNQALIKEAHMFQARARYR